jgi:hypothetical protein
MKTTKFMLVTGAVTMAAVGVFAAKPTKKFAAATQIYAGGAYNRVLLTGAVAASAHLTTVQGSLKTAFFKTIGGAAVTLLTKAAGATVFFKP